MNFVANARPAMLAGTARYFGEAYQLLMRYCVPLKCPSQGIKMQRTVLPEYLDSSFGISERVCLVQEFCLPHKNFRGELLVQESNARFQCVNLCLETMRHNFLIGHEMLDAKL